MNFNLISRSCHFGFRLLAESKERKKRPVVSSSDEHLCSPFDLEL